jgi:hypothetical protein
VGGFVGSRNCIDSAALKSATLGQENGSDDYNDVDDYNGEDNYNESSSAGKDYDLSTTVNYDTNNDNIKKIRVTVKGGAKTGNFQTSVFYDSTNLGFIKINKRAW